MLKTIEPEELKQVGPHDCFIHQISNNNPIFTPEGIENQLMYTYSKGFNQTLGVSTGLLQRWSDQGDAIIKKKAVNLPKITEHCQRKETQCINRLLFGAKVAGYNTVYRIKSPDELRATPKKIPHSQIKKTVAKLQAVLQQKNKTRDIPQKDGIPLVRLTAKESENKEAVKLEEELKKNISILLRNNCVRLNMDFLQKKKGLSNFLTTWSGQRELYVVSWDVICGKTPLSDYQVAAAQFHDRLAKEEKVAERFRQLVKAVTDERMQHAQSTLKPDGASAAEVAEREAGFKMTVYHYLVEEIIYFQLLINAAVNRHQQEKTKGAMTYLAYPYKDSVIGTLVFTFMRDINPTVFQGSSPCFQFFDNTSLLKAPSLSSRKPISKSEEVAAAVKEEEKALPQEQKKEKMDQDPVKVIDNAEMLDLLKLAVQYIKIKLVDNAHATPRDVEFCELLLCTIQSCCAYQSASKKEFNACLPELKNMKSLLFSAVSSKQNALPPAALPVARSPDGVGFDKQVAELLHSLKL